jgi:hypothetical protein
MATTLDSAEPDRPQFTSADFVGKQRALGRSISDTLIEVDKAWPSLPFRVAIGGIFLDLTRHDGGPLR